jgi:hypothetical protein
MSEKLLGRRDEISKECFRYRGLSSTRLENLTDAISGFAYLLIPVLLLTHRKYRKMKTNGLFKD